MIKERRNFIVNQKEEVFISLTDDLLFKEVMAHSHNREALIYFLKLKLGIKESIIRNNLVVQYESILDKTKLNDKNLSGDVIIKFADYVINLENYSVFDNNSLIKSLSYLMRIFSTQLDRGATYNKMKKIIQINMINNDETKLFKKYKNFFHIINDEELNFKLIPTKFIEIVYNLDKIKNKPYNELDDEERFDLFIRARDRNERNKIAKGCVILENMEKFIDEYINDEKTKEIYGKWGEYIALEKGKRAGLKEEKFNTARAMLNDNLSIDKIIKYTGLSKREIKTLQN